MQKIIIAIISVILVCTGCVQTGREKTESVSVDKTEVIHNSKGKYEPIPIEIQEKMKGVSMPEGADISFDELAYLTIPHYNFSGEVVYGHMVVNLSLADEVLCIFEELYNIKFPIEKMELIDDFVPYIDDVFDSLDRASMSQNNTSSFCYRVIAGTENISYHAYGKAIDINPKTNPYCVLSTGYVSPANAYEFADRNQDVPGMIKYGDDVYNIFTKYGWEWGGDWDNIKDYQHFQKTI